MLPEAALARVDALEHARDVAADAARGLDEGHAGEVGGEAVEAALAALVPGPAAHGRVHLVAARAHDLVRLEVAEDDGRQAAPVAVEVVQGQVLAGRLVGDDVGERLPRRAREEVAERVAADDGRLPEQEAVLLRLRLLRVEDVGVLARLRVDLPVALRVRAEDLRRRRRVHPAKGLERLAVVEDVVVLEEHGLRRAAPPVAVAVEQRVLPLDDDLELRLGPPPALALRRRQRRVVEALLLAPPAAGAGRVRHVVVGPVPEQQHLPDHLALRVGADQLVQSPVLLRQVGHDDDREPARRLGVVDQGAPRHAAAAGREERRAEARARRVAGDADLGGPALAVVAQLLRDGAPVAPRPRSRVRDEREQRQEAHRWTATQRAPATNCSPPR